jgi:hypothetical protein
VFVKAIKAVTFWLVIALSGAGVYWAIRQEPRQWIPEGMGIVALVLVMQLFLSRFRGPRRRIASIMVNSALFAVAAGAAAVFKFELIRFFGNRTDLIEALVAVTVFAIFASIAIWSFMRLRKLKVVS